MNLLNLTLAPPPPLFLGTPFSGGGGGSIFFAYCGHCAPIWTQVLNTFFLTHGPLTQWQGSWVQTAGIPGRPWPPKTSFWASLHYIPLFFFYMDPLINDGGLGCYLQVSQTGPLMTGEGFPFFGPAWVGSKIAIPM